MRKLLVLGAAAAALSMSAVALVPAPPTTYGPASSVNIPLTGELPKACTISAYVNGPFNNLDLTSTVTQSGESLTGTCNYGNGTATVSITSANNGNLKRNGGTELVPYLFSIPSAGLGETTLSTTPTVINNFVVSNGGTSRTMAVRLPAAATIAGVYEDIVTAAITPN